VPIPGFDEAMLLLGDAMEFDVPEKIVLARAEDRAKRIVEQAQALQARLKKKTRVATEVSSLIQGDMLTNVSSSTPKNDDATSEGESKEISVLAEAVEKTMKRGSGALRWWQWEARANAASDVAERESIYQVAIAALPDSAELLHNYAKFLQQIRKDYGKAETYYIRAFAAAPGNATILNNYAYFLQSVRKDYDRAEAYYGQGIAADPENGVLLCNYAMFLDDIRKDHDKAEIYYNRAISVNPADPALLWRYAEFLWFNRKDYEKAESNYIRAIAADPTGADVLCSYAYFQASGRKNYELAESLYKEALAKNSDIGIFPRYARFLLSIGRTDDGLIMLDRAVAAIEKYEQESLVVRVWMCATCHWIPDRWREALMKLKQSVLVHHMTDSFGDYAEVIESAKKRGHPAAEWLEPLAAVCNGKADVSTLDAWPAWREA
jgi:Tfp pilus assembly protein PilF